MIRKSMAVAAPVAAFVYQPVRADEKCAIFAEIAVEAVTVGSLLAVGAPRSLYRGGHLDRMPRRQAAGEDADGEGLRVRRRVVIGI